MVATIKVNGTATRAVFVGGGDGNFYALNASNGRVIWQTRLGTPPGYFLWSSPVLYRGSIYEGVASFGDCPLIRGGVVRMDTATGKVQNRFYTAPRGCTGAERLGVPDRRHRNGRHLFRDRQRRTMRKTRTTWCCACPDHCFAEAPRQLAGTCEAAARHRQRLRVHADIVQRFDRWRRSSDGRPAKQRWNLLCLRPLAPFPGARSGRAGWHHLPETARSAGGQTGRTFPPAPMTGITCS